MENSFNLMWLVYLIDGFSGDPFPEFTVLAALTITLILLLGGFIYLVMCDRGPFTQDEQDSAKETYKQLVLNKITVTFILWSMIIAPGLNALIPDKDTAYKMIAVYGAQTIAEMEKVQAIGSKSLDVLNKVMDDYLNEPEDS